MATVAVASKPAESPLYFHPRYDAYECLGCGEMLEVPKFARLKIDNKIQRVAIKGDPLNLLLWREMQEIDHGECAQFQDVEKAKDHREHRATIRTTAAPSGP